jgi:hypothetical protein
LKNTSTTLIEVLLKTIDRVGIAKTIKVLEVSQNTMDEQQFLHSLILLNTCNHFGISEKTLLNGRKNIANRTNAIGVCCVLMLKMCKYNQRQISKILNKEPSNVNKYIKKYENLDKNFKADFDIMYKMEVIEKETIKFYELNKKENNNG